MCLSTDLLFSIFQHRFVVNIVLKSLSLETNHGAYVRHSAGHWAEHRWPGIQSQQGRLVTRFLLSAECVFPKVRTQTKPCNVKNPLWWFGLFLFCLVSSDTETNLGTYGCYAVGYWAVHYESVNQGQARFTLARFYNRRDGPFPQVRHGVARFNSHGGQRKLRPHHEDSHHIVFLYYTLYPLDLCSFLFSTPILPCFHLPTPPELLLFLLLHFSMNNMLIP